MSLARLSSRKNLIAENTSKYRPVDEKERSIVHQISGHEWQLLRARALDAAFHESLLRRAARSRNSRAVFAAEIELATSKTVASLRTQELYHRYAIRDLERRLGTLRHFSTSSPEPSPPGRPKLALVRSRGGIPAAA
ncbi:MAG: hypothetical protein FJW30_23275 [Acidobacteria bacterium]|nr:hypothetical protein [Acidobacteriota bacterium]